MKRCFATHNEIKDLRPYFRAGGVVLRFGLTFRQGKPAYRTYGALTAAAVTLSSSPSGGLTTNGADTALIPKLHGSSVVVSQPDTVVLD